MKSKIVALIMARGGSKSIPRKNIAKVHGYPLIAWSIAACKLSKKIDEIIVSSDDEKIISVAKKFGGNAPFVRPKKYATDKSTDLEVFKHFLEWHKKNRLEKIRMIVHIRPTTPMRDPKIIDKAIIFFEKNFNNFTSLRSIYEMPETSWKNFERKKNGILKSLIEILKPRSKNKELANLPRQNLPKTFFAQGYVDIVKPNIIKQNSTFGNKIYGYITNDVGEIDNSEQLKKINNQKIMGSKALFKYLKKN